MGALRRDVTYLFAFARQQTAVEPRAGKSGEPSATARYPLVPSPPPLRPHPRAAPRRADPRTTVLCLAVQSYCLHLVSCYIVPRNSQGISTALRSPHIDNSRTRSIVTVNTVIHSPAENTPIYVDIAPRRNRNRRGETRETLVCDEIFEKLPARKEKHSCRPFCPVRRENIFERQYESTR